MEFFEFVKELRAINPDAEIYVAETYGGENKIYVEGVKNLKLPKDFYYSEKNGITNKHNSKNGLYLNVQVEKFTNELSPNNYLPEYKVHNTIIEKTAKPDKTKDYDIYSFYKEFSELNPSLKLNLSYPQFDSMAETTIYFTPDENSNKNTEVKCPEGFIYDKKSKTFSNKGNVKSGNYLDIKIVNTKKMDYDVPFMKHNDIMKKYMKSAQLEDSFKDYVPDISESTDKFEILNAIQKLNPKIKITTTNSALTSTDGIYYDMLKSNQSYIYLPKGFYYDEKNGLTNKHNTKSGLYASLPLDPIDKKLAKVCYTQTQINNILNKSKNLEQNNISL